MKLDELVEIGQVARPWGVKGEVKIRLTTDVPGRFDNLEGVYLHDGRSQPVFYSITWVKNLKDAVAVKFEGIDSPEEAENLREMEVSVPESERAPLTEGEYYIYDLIDLDVVDQDGRRIGKLEKVYQGAAHDIFEVATVEGSVMVPAVPEYVHEVDLVGRRIVLTLPVLEEDL